MIKYLAVFGAMVLVDACWAFYVTALQERNALVSGFWSATIVGVSAFVVVSYVEDPWAITAAAAGAFVGTILGLRFKK